MRNIVNHSARLAIVLVCLASGPGFGDEPVVGGPCEGCEYVFVDMPAELHSRAEIAPADEPGERMIIEGTVRTLAGEPAKGIVVYAYHTDAGGVYPRGKTRHGRLRGWAQTDEDGSYRFDTIRPGAYPGRNISQHVHLHVIERGRATYYIANLEFDDDPLLTPSQRQRAPQGRGGNGIDHPAKDEDGIWRVRRDITLRLNIRDYPSEQK